MEGLNKAAACMEYSFVKNAPNNSFLFLEKSKRSFLCWLFILLK